MITWVCFFSLFSLATVFAYLLTPIVRRLAVLWGVVDVPNDRKPHEDAVPTMGGIAMYLTFFGALAAASVSYSVWKQEPLLPYFKFSHLVLGATPLVLIGMIDDRFRINYKWKLAVQIGVAILMTHWGYEIYGITNPLNGETVPLGFWGKGVTILWFLFIINAINFMDGIDGLAAGVSLIALITIFVVSLYLGNIQVAILAALLSGSVVGFFRYNFYPASIFMGDTGSLFLGFLIAVLSLKGAQKSSTAVALAVPIVILGLPILDAIGAVIRRWSSEWARSQTFLARMLSWRSVFYPDLGHIHHQLLARGLTKPQVVILLYLVAFGFGIIGFALAAARYQQMVVILVPLLILVGFMARKIFLK